MTWMAQLDASQDLFIRDVVRLRLAKRYPDGSLDVVSGVTEQGDLIVSHVTDSQAIQPDVLSLALPADALHAILATIARHLGAVEHPEQLRSDYNAERARVDRLIGYLIGGTP